MHRPRRFLRSLCGSALFLLLSPAVLLVCISSRSGNVLAADVDDVGGSETTAAWIEKLGSESYATRQRAKAKLRGMGLEALDALRQAQTNPDNEIAMAARHLIGSRLINWFKPSDSPEVQQILKAYGARSSGQREAMIQRLGTLSIGDSAAALARLCRFETEPRLSHAAGLALMRQNAPQEAAKRLAAAAGIEAVIQDSDRTACQWLLQYATDLRQDDFGVDAWSDLLRDQRQQLDRRTNEMLNEEILLQFVQTLASLAVKQNRTAAGLRLATEHLDLVQPTKRHLTDTAAWALENDLGDLVLTLRKSHRRMFDRDPVLIYSAAEALFRADRVDEANRLAESALAVDAIPDDPKDADALSPQAMERLALTHIGVAGDLRERGFFRWAQREYESVIDQLDLGNPAAGLARNELAKMYSDLYQHDQVIATLGPLIDRMNRDEEYVQQMVRRAIVLPQIESLSAYHLGLQAVEDGDVELAKDSFGKSYRLGGGVSIDALIAMYRVDGGERWNSRIRDIVRQQTLIFNNAVVQAMNQGRGGLGFGGRDLSGACNQYAWLVANTEGDFAKALRLSEQSVELNPNEAPLIDTLARCHFALGNLAKAVAYQRQAIKLMPHFPPLKRQLAEFELALAKSRETPE